MQLSNLQHLTGLLSQVATLTDTPVQLAEAQAHKDMDGIRNIVEDALGDLSDKLGKGGSLATLFKSSGASKLDTEKDEDGKNVLQQIIAKTTAFKKDIEKLLVEAEILVSQINEGKLNEATSSADYDDSSVFTNEFYTISEQVNGMKAKMKSPRWMGWMKDTDNNYGTDCVAPARAAISAVGSLALEISNIESELDKANEA